MLVNVLQIAAGLMKLANRIPGWLADLRTRLMRSKIHRLENKVKTLEVRLRTKEARKELNEKLKKKLRSASTDDIDDNFRSS